MTTDRQFGRAVDRAIAAENRRAIADGEVLEVPLEPRFPPGSPEYEAFAAELRAALADTRVKPCPECPRGEVLSTAPLGAPTPGYVCSEGCGWVG